MNKEEKKEIIKNRDLQRLQKEYLNNDLLIKSKERSEYISRNYEKCSLLKDKGENGFKFYQNTNYTNYYYFVSNLGRIILVRADEEILNELKNNEISIFEILTVGNPKYEDKNYNVYWFMPINHENLCIDIIKFIENNPIHSGCTFDSTTPVYKFVSNSWLQEEKEIAYKIANDKERIETHHISGYNNDCSVYNLIELPNSLHAKVHVHNNL